jgi:hypothetical protein
MAETRRRSWPLLATATAVAVAAWAWFWWLAVPRFDICVAVLPAPAGCRSADRVGVATGWSVAVAVLYVATVTLVLLRPSGRRWPSLVAMAVLGTAALWGVRDVLYAGG